MTPTRALRRPLTITAGVITATLVLLSSPLTLALAAVAQALGRPKPLIAMRLICAYCARELAVLLAAAGLWVLSAAGLLIDRPLFQRLHWALLRWYVHGLASRAQRLLGITVDDQCPPEVAHALAEPEPLIVLSRHAGPGDTAFLIDRLLCRYHRRPSVVLREAIALDPAIDLLTARLPHGVIDKSRGEDAQEQIEALAAGLRPGGALLLYPEGGNFTVERRRAALASLRRKGRSRAAAAATQMDNVLPPRPSGVLCALRGAPRANVLFVAHTGLGLAAYPRQIYRELPIGGTLRFHEWLVARDEVPATEEGQVAWLNRWWQELDDWIERQHSDAPGAGAERPPGLSAEPPPGLSAEPPLGLSAEPPPGLSAERPG